MDLDVVSQIRPETLEKAVDSILQNQAFTASLATQGIQRIVFSKPKQTDTTQRWKISVFIAMDNAIQTKIEFSRRKDKIDYLKGVPDPELLRKYKAMPFATQFYEAPQMAKQKIAALAAPSRYALRDLFDIHHLIFTNNVPLKDISLDVDEAEKAIDKINRFTYKDFSQQVLPYLSPELFSLYEDKPAFDRLKEEVQQKMLEAIS